MSTKTKSPEFSRVVMSEGIPLQGRSLEISAKPDERAALAKRFDLLSLDVFKAEIRLVPLAGGRVRVGGRLHAHLSQRCGVTLEPVPARVDESFSLTFAPDAGEACARHEAVMSLEDEDEPEPMTDGAIDLGEVAAEQLALMIDPFPRAPGAVFEPFHLQTPFNDDDTGRANPFAVLAALKERSGDEQ